MKEDFVKNALE
jgi:hypothetical protein